MGQYITNSDILILSGSSLSIGNTIANAPLDISGSGLISGSLTVLKGITGSLQGTSSWASNVISSSYALTASYALNAGSGGTVSTASLLTTASVSSNTITFTKGDGSTFPITVATGSGGGSTFPYTGSALITGSLGITGSLSVSNSLDTSNRSLYTFNGVRTVDWLDGRLYDTANVLSIDWGSKVLADFAGIYTVDWGNNALYDGSGISSVTWGERTLYDTEGISSADWNARRLVDVNASGSVDWNTRLLKDTTGTTNLDWSVPGNVTTQRLHVSGAITGTNGLTLSGGNITTTGFVSASLGFTGSLFGTASWAMNALTASYAANISSYNVTQSFTNSSTWTFNHNLNYKSVLIQAYDTTDAQIIPQTITLTDANTATITFPVALSGYAVATVGGALATATASYAVSSSYALTASYVNTLNQNVTIGNVTSTPPTENTLNIYPPIPTSGTGEGGQILLAASGGLYSSASMLDTYQNQFRLLKGTNTGGSTVAYIITDLQTGNTQFAGAVTASAYSGLPNSWLSALRNGSQTIGSGTWANRDVIFNDVSSNNFTYNSSTGVATLKANKTYRITARVAWYAAAVYTFQIRIYNQTTSAFTGPTAEMVQATNGTNNISDGTLEYIFAVGASDTDISIRTTSATNALTGEYIRGDLNTQLIIQQIA